MLTITALGATSEYFTSKVALATGIASAGAGVGSLVLPLIAKVLIDEYGYRRAFLINGAIVLNTVPCSALFRPLLRTIRGGKRASDKTVSINASTSQLLEFISEPGSVCTDSALEITRNDLDNGSLCSNDQQTVASVEDAVKRAVTEKKRMKRQHRFAWEIFKDARFWVLCISVIFADASALNFTVYVPLLSVELGGNEINEAIGVSMSSVVGTVCLVLFSALWDVGVFRKVTSRQIGFSLFSVLVGVAISTTALITNYAHLLVWVIILQPMLGMGALSTFYMIVRDIATPERYADALSATYLFEAPFTFFASLFFGKRIFDTGTLIKGILNVCFLKVSGNFNKDQCFISPI